MVSSVMVLLLQQLGRNLKQAQTDVLLCLLQRNRESRERFWMPAHLEDLHKGVQSEKTKLQIKIFSFT